MAVSTYCLKLPQQHSPFSTLQAISLKSDKGLYAVYICMSASPQTNLEIHCTTHWTTWKYMALRSRLQLLLVWIWLSWKVSNIHRNLWSTESQEHSVLFLIFTVYNGDQIQHHVLSHSYQPSMCNKCLGGSFCAMWLSKHEDLWADISQVVNLCGKTWDKECLSTSSITHKQDENRAKGKAYTCAVLLLYMKVFVVDCLLLDRVSMMSLLALS